MDTTTLIISTIIGIITIIAFVGTFLTKQTELSVKLANIEKELAEIKKLLKDNSEKQLALEKKVFILEQEKSKKGGK
jgi:ABC-type Fe3+-citrate transport system substrate-binding protein